MSTENTNNKTGDAAEAATNLIPDQNANAAVAVDVGVDGDGGDDDNNDGDPYVTIRIKTVHQYCGGIIVNRGEKEVDKTVRCEDQDDIHDFCCLSDFTYEDLDREIFEIIGLSGDHGAAEGNRYYNTFEYVYDEEGKEARSLECVDDEELRSILAGGSGFVNVEWYW